jgi:hypothetical protein
VLFQKNVSTLNEQGEVSGQQRSKVRNRLVHPISGVQLDPLATVRVSTTVALLHGVVIGRAVLVVLHVVSTLDVDTAVVELLKLVQLLVPEVELDFVKVGMTVLETKVVELAAVVVRDDVRLAEVDEGMDELVDERVVGLTVLVVVFQMPVSDMVDVIVLEAPVPVEVKLVVVLTVVAVDEVTFAELLLADEATVEVKLALDVSSSVHVVEGAEVLLDHEKVELAVEDVTGPVPVKLDEALDELIPVPLLEKDDVVELDDEELPVTVEVTVVGVAIVVQ